MHDNIEYLIDIHRDSQGRDKTTVQHNNLNYAQVYFVVGTNNPNWEKNMRFAERIQKGLNDKVPDLSKGIYKKTPPMEMVTTTKPYRPIVHL